MCRQRRAAKKNRCRAFCAKETSPLREGFFVVSFLLIEWMVSYLLEWCCACLVPLILLFYWYSKKNCCFEICCVLTCCVLPGWKDQYDEWLCKLCEKMKKIDVILSVVVVMSYSAISPCRSPFLKTWRSINRQKERRESTDGRKLSCANRRFYYFLFFVIEFYNVWKWK